MEPNETKICFQCKKECSHNQFKKKERSKSNPTCRTCMSYSSVTTKLERPCSKCLIILPRDKFSVHQWINTEESLICIDCGNQLQRTCLNNVKNSKGDRIKTRADGSLVCSNHDLESCNICMLDFINPNKIILRQKQLGRYVTSDELMEMYINDPTNIVDDNLCILDGTPVCARTGKKLRCPCQTVTYCSKVCQRHHWTIHRMGCSLYGV